MQQVTRQMLDIITEHFMMRPDSKQRYTVDGLLGELEVPRCGVAHLRLQFHHDLPLQPRAEGFRLRYRNVSCCTHRSGRLLQPHVLAGFIRTIRTDAIKLRLALELDQAILERSLLLRLDFKFTVRKVSSRFMFNDPYWRFCTIPEYTRMLDYVREQNEQSRREIARSADRGDAGGV